MKHFLPSRQNGFTLLELLLVVGLSALLIIGVAQMARDWADSENAKGAGVHLQKTSDAVQEFVAANWATLTPVNDAVWDGLNTAGSPWNGLVGALGSAGVLDATTNIINSPVGSPLLIGFNIAGVAPNRTFTTLVYTPNPVLNKRVRAAAREGGPFAGVWLSYPDVTKATGAFNQWQVPDTMLIGGVSPLYTATPTTDKGYLLSVITINESQMVGPYLYRDFVGGTQYNTMSTPLNMNGNDIKNIAVLSAIRMNVTDTVTTNDLVVNSSSQLGQLNVGNDMTVTGSLTANDVTASTLDTPSLTVDNLTPASGTLSITGNIDLGTTGTLTAPAVTATTCMNIAGTSYGTATCP